MADGNCGDRIKSLEGSVSDDETDISGGGRGLEGAAAVKAAGYNAIVPVWGERIV